MSQPARKHVDAGTSVAVASARDSSGTGDGSGGGSGGVAVPRSQVLAHELLHQVATASRTLARSLDALRRVSPHVLDSSAGGLVRDVSLTLATVRHVCACRRCCQMPRAAVSVCCPSAPLIP